MYHDKDTDPSTTEISRTNLNNQYGKVGIDMDVVSYETISMSFILLLDQSIKTSPTVLLYYELRKTCKKIKGVILHFCILYTITWNKVVIYFMCPKCM